MRMYLGHICTVVLLPSCHRHCLSSLAFMYCRTKYVPPVVCSPFEGDVAYWSICDCVCFLGTTVTLNICFLVMLVWSVPFWVYMTSSIAFFSNPLFFSVCGSIGFTHNRLHSQPSLIMHFMHWLQHFYLRVYIPNLPPTVRATDLFALSLIKLAFLLKKKSEKRKYIWKKAKFNKNYFWKVIYRKSI